MVIVLPGSTPESDPRKLIVLSADPPLLGLKSH